MPNSSAIPILGNQALTKRYNLAKALNLTAMPLRIGDFVLIGRR
jgi:hypothetical protein